MRSMLKTDLPASLVVFIIAIPLSLGIALASGVPMSAGIVAAVVGGLVVGLTTGAPLVVTGPAAGLTALCFQYVNTIGYVGLCIATVLAGFMQVGFSSLRLGGMFEKVPRAIIVGMLMAIGITIVLGQIHILLGSATVPKSVLASIAQIPESVQTAFSQQSFWTSAAAFGTAALAFQIFWARSKVLSKLLPGALPAVVIVTILSLSFVMPRVEIAPLADAAMQGIQNVFGFSNWSQIGAILAAAVGLAAVASAETLLTIRAAEEVKVPARPCNLNRELMVQGLGNSVSGVLGGLPMTGVMVRTAANINSGAQTRWSTVFHAVWILVFMLLMPDVVKAIPLAALASVLILTGIKLINFKQLKALYSAEKNSFYGALACCSLIVVSDLLTGLSLSLLAYIGWVFVSKQKSQSTEESALEVEIIKQDQR